MKTILIIDDDDDLLDIVFELLTDSGFKVVASHREIEMEGIIAIGPDLILLDFYLSTAQGNEICIKLKDDPRTKHIPVVLISGHVAIQDIAKNCGADLAIAKPFDINHLEQKVKELVF